MMTTTNEMYRIQPIFQVDEKISLPTCMYTMKNLHGEFKHDLLPAEMVEQKSPTLDILEQQPPPELALLEAQQEDILRKLACLKEQIEKFRLLLNEPVKKSPQLALGIDLQDIVVYASPSVPPYGILALKAIWDSSPGIQISSHTHSSLRSPPPVPVLRAFSPERSCAYDIHITLVWKEVGQHVQAVISPTRHTVLQGEVNLLRLLSHLNSTRLGFEASPAHEAAVADWILDLVYQLVQGSTPKRELVAALSKLAPGQAGWLLNKSNPTVVDAALWSYFKSKGALECPAKLKNWMNTCNNLFLK